MRPPGVVLDIETTSGSPPRTSSDFEEISYPLNHWATAHQEEELPLHYMNEDKARRRITRGPGSAVGHGGDKYAYEDDEGKDVYSKARAGRHGVPAGSGRIRHAPPPPATSIVRFWFFDFHLPLAQMRADRVPAPESRACPTCYIYTSLLLDPFLQDRTFECCCLG